MARRTISCVVILVLVLVLGLAFGSRTAQDVRFVAFVVSNGARSPLAPFAPLDKRVMWPMGYAQLTPSGQRQMYLLGRVLRKYYIEDGGLIGKTYNQSRLYVRSTSNASAIMSAGCLSVGLYPDNLTKLNNAQLAQEWSWTPPFNLTIPDSIKRGLGSSALPFDMPVVPVISFNRSYDQLLGLASCPMHSYLRNAFYRTKEFSDLFASFNETLQSLCLSLSIDCTSVDGKDVFYLVDYIRAAEFDGQLPELKSKQKELGLLEKFYTQLLSGELRMKPIMSAIAISNFASLLPTYLKAAIENPQSAQRMVALTTEESTLLGYLNALQLETPENINKTAYASQLAFELIQDSKDSSHYINIYYNGQLIREHSPYAEFVEQLKKAGTLTDAWDKVCLVPEPDTDSMQKFASQTEPVLESAWLILPTGFAIVILLSILGGLWIRKGGVAIWGSQEQAEAGLSSSITAF